MKGLGDGPVKTYLFREYPSTLEATTTLAMQEEFSLRQAKLHTNVPRPPRPAAKTEGPEPMDLSYASAVGQHKKKGNDSIGAGRSTGNAATRVYNGHAVLRNAAPSERESHCEMQDDMPNLVILKVFVDDKFDMVLGMPWLARHDPIIDWEKRTVVRFGRRGATESDGPVSTADTPNDASEHPSETVTCAAVPGRSAWSARAVTTPGVVNRKGCLNRDQTLPRNSPP
ncbi:hypothetical protein PHMEG_00033673 [Phytophthora megakarya]|uniref:Reverse transcriptase n=1 Tax=Phytophthora megakarya TaxID=4795 RepID=A0A225UVA2_9STRA|nr:hypothetical protein PHMEG_00033673 [Phytophthora megakarya]